MKALDEGEWLFKNLMGQQQLCPPRQNEKVPAGYEVLAHFPRFRYHEGNNPEDRV